MNCATTNAFFVMEDDQIEMVLSYLRCQDPAALARGYLVLRISKIEIY